MPVGRAKSRGGFILHPRDHSGILSEGFAFVSLYMQYLSTETSRPRWSFRWIWRKCEILETKPSKSHTFT